MTDSPPKGPKLGASPGAPVRRTTGPGGALPQPRRDTLRMGAVPRLNLGEERQAAPLTLQQVRAALGALVSGKAGSYKALVSLQRAVDEDLDVVIAATNDGDPQQRWKLLWAASGFVARGMRAPQGHTAAVNKLRADLGLAHFFALFARRRNPAAKKVLERARDAFLPFMLEQISQSTDHARKLQLLAGIVEHIESREAPLRAAIRTALGPDAVDTLITHLVLHEDPRSAKADSRRLSQRLHGQLEALRQAAMPDGGNDE